VTALKVGPGGARGERAPSSLQQEPSRPLREATSRSPGPAAGPASRIPSGYRLRPVSLLEKEVQRMHIAIVEFQYGDDFDRAHLADIAREERGRFEGLPQLRLKAFAIDEENRRALTSISGSRRALREGSLRTRWSTW
jgi:hypothetical protein